MSTFYNLILQKAKYKSGGDTPTPPPVECNAFYVEDCSGVDNSLTLKKGYGATQPILEYSTDGGVWNSWAEPYTTALPIKANSKVYLRGTNNVMDSTIITTTANFNVGGDVTTLLVPEGGLTDLSYRNSCFRNFFKNSKIVNAKDLILPSTTLALYCYGYMFQGCTSLTTAPKVLPATTLANNCYYYMFNGCTSLVNTPTLPATTLAEGCYYNMFNGCTSLVNAPALPALEMTTNCYVSMFQGCTSLTTAPKELPATNADYNCYSAMFKDCTALTLAPEIYATYANNYAFTAMFENCTSLLTAPKLHVTYLMNWVLSGMFSGCSKLNYIEVSAITWKNRINWLDGVAPSGTFVKPKELIIGDGEGEIPRGADGIPSGWTIQNV